MRRQKELADITLQQHHETERAYLVSDSGERDKAVWIPKSQCERGDKIGPNLYEFTMPQSLAEEKGLV